MSGAVKFRTYVTKSKAGHYVACVVADNAGGPFSAPYRQTLFKSEKRSTAAAAKADAREFLETT